MAIQSLKIMADLETTTDPADVRAWAVCAVDIDKPDNIVHLSNNLPAFMEWLSKGKNTKCWFHNLKFDGEYILYYLLSNGFTYRAGSDQQGNRYTLKNKEFTTLITDDGLFYSIEVVFKRHEKGKLEKVTFYDSLKKLPFKVKQIAKAFNLDETKGEIDYKAYRAPDHQLTDQEKDYVVRDCKIVAKALHIQFGQGLKKMTNASDALSSYKALIGKNKFEKRFPIFPIELDAAFRKAYKGGYTYLNPRYRMQKGIRGRVYDVNSLYPWAMYNCLLPYGYPVFFEGEPEPDPAYPLYIVHFKACFELKPGHLPTLQLKKSRFKDTEYLTTSRVKMKGKKSYFDDEPVEMWLTNVDYQLLLDHYDLTDKEYIDGYKFKGIIGLFKDYIDYWMHIKETSEGPLRQLAKLMLNSLYGKFASTTKGRVKIPYIDPETDTVQYDFSEETIREPIYTPMACFITAYAREKTIRSAQANYDRFIYADTDSLHLEGWEIPENLVIHKSDLGAWKDEGRFINSVYIRAKTYMESILEEKEDTLENYAKLLCSPFTEDVRRDPDKIRAIVRKVTCAGMPDNVKEYANYETFYPGAKFTGKLVPRRYPGGIILEDTTFTIYN